jgi:two-component SAPR family response regulator
MASLLARKNCSNQGEGRLHGRVVLVVEDEYYVASDASEAIKAAGAIILGPCPTVASTMHVLEEFQPSHAVVDLNLDGQGPSFDIARQLKARAVQIIFMTGYDASVLPDDLAGLPCIQKPMTYDEVVTELARTPRRTS